ncbi:probable calcium-binding protein CML45 isoform X1 [Telopea speciosissima]|uniref:probable calcium-binding protein CML45 isoform X1 n=1 Tax=Telopea speciosissima TaxID=54955 RepID=UPI001CC3A5EF|nr:probable calcium-binding protein CML45 isoform X1 [Telopea speciosissima]
MESKTPNTISTSLPVAGFVGIPIFHKILNWVPKIQLRYSSFRSLLQLKHGFGIWVEMKNHCPELASKQVFLEDKEGDDEKLSRKDMEMVMENLGIFCNPNDETLEERLGYEEFSVLFENEEPSLEEVKEAFDVFDQNKDGFIDAMELQRVLHSLGFLGVFKMEDCKRMMETFDTNRDGRIDFNEFLKLTENSFQLKQRHG